MFGSREVFKRITDTNSVNYENLHPALNNLLAVLLRKKLLVNFANEWWTNIFSDTKIIVCSNKYLGPPFMNSVCKFSGATITSLRLHRQACWSNYQGGSCHTYANSISFTLCSVLVMKEPMFRVMGAASSKAKARHHVFWFCISVSWIASQLNPQIAISSA